MLKHNSKYERITHNLKNDVDGYPPFRLHLYNPSILMGLSLVSLGRV